MSKVTVKLQDGFDVGERRVDTLVIRPPTAGDLIDAQSEAERAVLTPDGYQLLVSNSLLSIHVMRRQVTRVGDDSGPMDLSLVKRMTARDLDLLTERCEALDIALAKELENRGRSEGACG